MNNLILDRDPRMNEKPLREVVRELTAQRRKLDDLNDKISDRIRDVEAWLATKPKKVVFSTITDGVQLAWSGARGTWRLVIKHEDNIVRLLDASQAERSEVFTSGAMERLLDQLR